MAPTISAPVDPQDLSAMHGTFLYKISYESLHNLYSIGTFVLIFLFIAVVLPILCNFLLDINCRKSRDRKKITNVAPPKRIQTVYSSMLPPREDFVMVDMDLMMNSVDTQTPDQVVEEKLASSRQSEEEEEQSH